MSAMRKKIEDKGELARRVEALDGWELEQGGHAIVRELRFESFMGAIAFIDRLAPIADRMDHHPEITNVYDRLTLRLTTHDAGGLTESDFTLASEIDALPQR